jgi:hypothetical protein
MAPEQFDGTVDERTDVWGLGATLYEALTTHRAFDGVNKATIRENVLTNQPVTPKVLVKNIPRDLEAICIKALQKAPSNRYSSAKDFADDLCRWLRREPVQARPAYAPRRMWMWSKRNKGWAAAVAASMLVIFSGTVFWVTLLQLNAAASRDREAEAQFQRLRLVARRNGWREAALAHADQLPRERKLALRDHIVAVLHGLDAENIMRLEKAGGSSVVFDATGQQLLIGGLNDLSVTKDDRLRPIAPLHPRVCRLRELPLDGAPQLLKELNDFNVHVYGTTTTSNGQFFVVWGLFGTQEKPVHGVKVYDNNGKAIWEQRDARLSSEKMDAPRRVLALSDPTRDQGVTLVEFPAGKVVGQFVGPCGDLAPNATYRATRGGPPTFGVPLFRSLEAAPLITLGIDVEPSSVVNEFSSDGRFLAWGNADGTVTVADLPEIERQITAAGAGW